MARAITHQRRAALRAAQAAEERGKGGSVAAAEGPREGFFQVNITFFKVSFFSNNLLSRN
jgi:hypothetical protein